MIRGYINVRKLVCPVCGEDMTVYRMMNAVELEGVKGLHDLLEIAVKKEDEELSAVNVSYKCPGCGFKANTDYSVNIVAEE